MWKFFDSSGAEKVISVTRPSFVTALPSNPSDGDEIIFTDSLTAPTYQWHFRYVSAKASNKWVFIGGSPLAAEDLDSGTRASTAYGDLNDTADSPSITIPVAGNYRVYISCYMESSSAAVSRMSYSIGAAAAADADSILTDLGAGLGTSVSREMTKTSLAASAALTAKYKATAGTLTAHSRRIHAIPIAIGG